MSEKKEMIMKHYPEDDQDFYDLVAEAKIIQNRLKIITDDRLSYFYLLLQTSLSVSLLVASLFLLFDFFSKKMYLYESFNDIGLPFLIMLFGSVLGLISGLIFTKISCLKIIRFQWRNKMAQLLREEISLLLDKAKNLDLIVFDDGKVY